jgi:hypothetical protein
MLWVVGLAWVTRDFVAANAEKAVLRTIAADSAFFVLVNTVASPGLATAVEAIHRRRLQNASIIPDGRWSMRYFR